MTDVTSITNSGKKGLKTSLFANGLLNLLIFNGTTNDDEASTENCPPGWVGIFLGLIVPTRKWSEGWTGGGSPFGPFAHRSYGGFKDLEKFNCLREI